MLSNSFTTLIIIGGIALLIGLFGGGIKVSHIDVPTLPVWQRTLSILVGIVLIALGIILDPSTKNPLAISIATVAPTTPVDKTIEPTDRAVETATPKLPTMIPTAIPATNTLIPTPLPNTPTDTPVPVTTASCNGWCQEIGQIPESGTKYSRDLTAGQLLFFSGGQLKIGDNYCGNEAKQVCIVLFEALKSQKVLIESVIPRNNYVGITDSLTAEEALNQKIPMLWMHPNCVDGCTKATVFFYRDGQLQKQQTLTPSTTENPNLDLKLCGDKAFANGSRGSANPLFTRPDGYVSGWITSDPSQVILSDHSIKEIPTRYVLIVEDLAALQLQNASIGNTWGCWLRADISSSIMDDASHELDRMKQDAPNAPAAIFKVSAKGLQKITK